MIWLFFYIHVYLLTLLCIDIKSSMCIHDFYTNKCFHILLMTIFQATRTVLCFFCVMISLMFIRNLLMVWLLYRNLWFYVNDCIPGLSWMCVGDSWILHGLYTPRILYGLYTPRTIRFIYISGCIRVLCFLNCVFHCFIHMSVFVSNYVRHPRAVMHAGIAN